MPGRKRRESSTKEPSRLISEVVADNVGALRRLRDISQDELAEQMRRLGHGWSRATVSETERGNRSIDVDELLALALVFRRSVPDLLDPASLGGDEQPEGIDYGAAASLPRWSATALVRDMATPVFEWPDGDGPPSMVALEQKPDRNNDLLRLQYKDVKAYRKRES